MRITRLLVLTVFMAAVLFGASAVAADYEPAEGYASPQVEAAVKSMLAESTTKGKVRMSAGGRWVRELMGKFTLPEADDLPDAAVAFIAKHKSAFGFSDPDRELSFTGRESLAYSTILYYQYLYKRVPVWGATVDVQVDKDGKLVLAVNRMGVIGDMDVKPAIDRDAAIKTVKAEYKKSRITEMPEAGAELVVYKGTLAYHVKFAEGSTVFGFFVDAHAGSLLNAFRKDMDEMGSCGGM